VALATSSKRKEGISDSGTLDGHGDHSPPILRLHPPHAAPILVRKSHCAAPVTRSNGMPAEARAASLKASRWRTSGRRWLLSSSSITRRGSVVAVSTSTKSRMAS
jgi:hypothetical protein